VTSPTAGGLELDEAGLAIGRDPRDMGRDELVALGHGKQPLLKVIRARCLDCCCEQPSEVRKCTAVRCANWPYRMGSDPFSERRGNAASLRQKSSALTGFSDEVGPAGRMDAGGGDAAIPAT
jgi:hypothetical protein